MYHKGRFPNAFFGTSLRPDSAALAVIALLFLVFVFLSLTVTAQPAQGQTYKVIYNIGQDNSGYNPLSGVTIDSTGNLYVTTFNGGWPYDSGSVFMLSPEGSGWAFSLLYFFKGGSDGAGPEARVIFGPDGSLYGTTPYGGENCESYGCGTVFELTPSGSGWTEQTLYAFQGGSDGAEPHNGDLVFDQAGDLYGTTYYGGYTGGYCAVTGCGTVFELTPSTNGWREKVLHRFTFGADGQYPDAGVILDQAGNLYGTNVVVYELTPSGSGWIENTIYRFQGSRGGWAFGGLIFDPNGNLYGATYVGGAGNAGTVFELMSSPSGWTYDLLYSFIPPNSGQANIGQRYVGPTASVTMDAAGNLYGTTSGGGLYDHGAVFKLTPSSHGWTYTSLHDFCRDGYPSCSDGANPAGGVTIGPNGNLYGTTANGGLYGWPFGVVWEITP